MTKGGEYATATNAGNMVNRKSTYKFFDKANDSDPTVRKPKDDTSGK
jgi:hypothetical protein